MRLASVGCFCLYLKDMDKIILIGGAPTVGKTYVAKKLAGDLKLPWISTDTIREMMVEIVDQKKYPNLYNIPKNVTADKYLSTHTPQQMVKEEIAESRDVWKGIKALMKEDYNWTSYVIEGVAIMPREARQIMKTDKRVRPVFLFSDNPDRFRKIIFTRGLWDDPETYSDEAKEVEIKWAMLFNDWIKKEAKKYRLPLVEVPNTKADMKKVKSCLKL